MGSGRSRQQAWNPKLPCWRKASRCYVYVEQLSIKPSASVLCADKDMRGRIKVMTFNVGVIIVGLSACSILRRRRLTDAHTDSHKAIEGVHRSRCFQVPSGALKCLAGLCVRGVRREVLEFFKWKSDRPSIVIISFAITTVTTYQHHPIIIYTDTLYTGVILCRFQ